MASILIVEDNPDASQPLVEFLESAGHTVSSVPDGKEALVRIINNSPDVVLLDLMLPEMGGPSLLEVIRSYPRLQTLPVAVWTGLGSSPLVQRAQALKVNSVLMKGKATFEEIRKALEEAAVRAPG